MCDLLLMQQVILNTIGPIALPVQIILTDQSNPRNSLRPYPKSVLSHRFRYASCSKY